MKYLVNLEIQKRQLLEAVLHTTPTAPTNPVNGQVYYNNTAGEEAIYGRIAGQWVNLLSPYEHPNFTAFNPELGGANVLATFQTNAEGHVTNVVTRVLTLEDLGYVGDPAANNYIHPTFIGNQLGAALTGVDVISNVAVNNEGHVTGFQTRSITNADIWQIVLNDTIISSTFGWSSEKIQQEIDDAIGGVSGGLNYIGPYNAATNDPLIDASDAATITTIEQGHLYVVSESGTFFTTPVTPGDMLIANIANPTLESHWSIIVRDIPTVPIATTEVKGIIEIATQEEVDQGTDATRAVTPATLSAYMANNEFVAVIGDNTNSVYTIAHNLNKLNVKVDVVDNPTGETIIAGVKRLDANTVQISSTQPVGLTQLTVLINK